MARATLVDLAQPVQRGDRHEGQQAPRDSPGAEERGHPNRLCGDALGGGRITSGSEAAISLSKDATSIPTGGSRPYHASRYRARIRRLARPIIPRRQFPPFPALSARRYWQPAFGFRERPPICYRPRRGDDGMMTSKNSLIIAPVILLLSAPALAQQPDARRGLALAREHCAPCHAIDNTSESPRAAAPPFASCVSSTLFQTCSDP